MIIRLAEMVRMLNSKEIKVSDVSKITGIHENTIRKIKSGENSNPTYEVMESLSDYLSSVYVHDNNVDIDKIKNKFFDSLTPNELQAVEDLLSGRCDKITAGLGSLRLVYALTKNDEIVYVGKTETHGLSRAAMHKSNGKDFDGILVRYIDENVDIKRVESAAILKAMPSQQGRNGRYKNGSKLSELPVLSVSLSDYFEDKGFING